MANFTKLYITDAGKELLNQKLDSEETLLFTEMVMSDQKYDVGILEKLTEIEGIRQRTGIRKIKREGNIIQLSSIFQNSELEDGYFINTLGVYAQLADSSPILFAVSVEQMTGAYMPQKSQTVSGIEIKLKITLENAYNITIQLDQSAVATVGDILDIENSVQGTLDAQYQQLTGYTDQKIAELINGAPSTLDTLGEIADAMQSNGDVVEALNAAIGTKANQAEVESLLNTKLDKTGNLQDTTVTFISNDTASPSEWENYDLFTSGKSAKSLFAQISTMAKNLRFLNKSLGGFALYPKKLTQAQYDALPEETKATQGLIFIVMKE